MRATLAVVLLLCLGNLAHATLTIPTVPVGNPGNTGELSGAGAGGYGPDAICGAVGYAFNIGKHEVTAGQYTEFLNAVASTDSYQLYSTSMWTNAYGCKIQRSGSPGNYTYSVEADWANRPVNYVSFWAACRFANWLHNGQPTGPQGPLTTEQGAYTLDGYLGNDGRNIQRNAGWRWAVTSEDEWYKAAYHKGGTGADYWDYPMQTDIPTVPSNDVNDPDGGNNANFFQNGYSIDSPYYRTNAGEFEKSESACGTFDQGGNLWEWNEAIPYIHGSYADRGLRGGAWDYLDNTMQASFRNYYIPGSENDSTGFRVSAIPEPSGMLAMIVGLGSLGLLTRRKR